MDVNKKECVSTSSKKRGREEYKVDKYIDNFINLLERPTLIKSNIKLNEEN